MDVTALDKVRKLNIGAGTLHLISAILIVVLANSFALPVVARYMAGPPGSGKYQMVAYGSVSMALLIAVFFLLSALAHFSVAGPRWRSYQANLAMSRNPYRWLEYALSSSIMIFAIAQLTGISDIAALIALIGVNASMIGFGWLQERYEQPGGSLLVGLHRRCCSLDRSRNIPILPRSYPARTWFRLWNLFLYFYFL